MKFTDLVVMAFQNLYRRKIRSAFNLSGIILGCTLLLLTLAALSGIKSTLYQLFDASEVAKKIAILNIAPEQTSPPEKAIKVEGEMATDRSERIKKVLKRNWMMENVYGVERSISGKNLNEFEAIEHVKNVVPNIQLSCDLSFNGQTVPMQMVNGVTSTSRSVRNSLTNGQWIESADQENQVLVNEFTAYKLGCKSELDFESLIGKTAILNFHATRHSMQNQLERMLGRFVGIKKEQLQQTLDAVKELGKKIDQTDLSGKTKKTLKTLISFLPNKATDKPTPILKMKFRIAGITRPVEGDLTDRIFENFYDGPDGELKIHYQAMKKIHLRLGGKPTYPFATAEVDSTKNLTQVVKEFEKRNINLISASEALEYLESRLNRSSWAIYGIVSIILLVSAIGISNTLFSSTFERTPEFGIMKAIGSSNQTILGLMLAEGFLLGMLGAMIAVIIGVGGSNIAHQFLANYLSQQYGMNTSGYFLFQFSIFSIGIVFAVSVLVCMVASVVPGWRAAKLDPIRAMQRR